MTQVHEGVQGLAGFGLTDFLFFSSGVLSGCISLSFGSRDEFMQSLSWYMMSDSVRSVASVQLDGRYQNLSMDYI